MHALCEDLSRTIQVQEIRAIIDRELLAHGIAVSVGPLRVSTFAGIAPPLVALRGRLSSECRQGRRSGRIVASGR